MGINYNIALMLSNIDLDNYSGYVNITFDLNESTKYILLHSTSEDIPQLQFFQDKNGNDIEIDCVGVYLEKRHDYYIIKAVP